MRTGRPDSAGQEFPRVEDLEKLQNTITTKMKEMLDDTYLCWTTTEFVQLRDMACAHLTLFNARRGGEPARLKLSDFTDAIKSGLIKSVYR